MACGADALGTSLNNSLTNDVPYNTPDVPLNGAQYSVPDTAQLKSTIVPLYNSNLTEGRVDGTGTFDVLMAGFSAHLQEEYKKNRITGAEYTKAFIALTEVAMAQGASYLLQKEGLYWDNLIKQQQAQLAEVQVATSRIKLETAKVEHVATQVGVLNLEADYATKKLQQSNLSSQFCISEYKLNNMMPREVAMVNAQITGQLLTNDTATWNLSTMLPSQHDMLVAQIAGQNTNNDGARYNVDYTMPAQLDIMKEQYEAARAQTLNTRSNGADVFGTLGAQRRLHDQQVQSYIQDTRIKVSKMYNDLWVTYITINDELLADNTTWPAPLRPEEIGEVLADLRSGVAL